MRYNPDTDRAVYNERMLAESDAKFKTSTSVTAPAPVTSDIGTNWAELEAMHRANAKVSGYINHSYATCCNLSHAIQVAIAMGNFPEVRRLRAQLIARLY